MHQASGFFFFRFKTYLRACLNDNLINKCDVRLYLCSLTLDTVVRLNYISTYFLEVQTPNNECADSCSDESIQGSSLMPILGKRMFLSIYQTKHTVQFCNTLFSLHFKLDTCVPECNTIGTMPSFFTLSVATNRKKRNCKDTK